MDPHPAGEEGEWGRGGQVTEELGCKAHALGEGEGERVGSLQAHSAGKGGRGRGVQVTGGSRCKTHARTKVGRWRQP